MNLAALLQTTRPPFLILAPISVVYGIAIAHLQQLSINSSDVWLLIVAALLAHISVNTFNEYFDFRSGLDLTTRKTPFSGGSGALPQAPQMAEATLILAVASLVGLGLIGCYYVYLIGVKLIPIGIAGMALIYCYTQWINKLPWLCLIAPGLGFGVLIPAGTLLVLGGELSQLALLLTLIPFLLVNNLLLLNQFPDIDADITVGRKTFPITYGTQASAWVFLVFALTAVITLMLLVYQQRIPLWCLVALLPMMLYLISFKGALNFGKQIGSQPPLMAANVIATLVTPSLIAVAMLLAG